MAREIESEIQGLFKKTDMPTFENPEPIKEVPKIDKSYFNIKPTKEEVEENWKGKTNENLTNRGSQNRVVNVFWYNLLIVLLILSLIFFVFFISWNVYNDKFKTSIVNNSTVVCESPDININMSNPKCPDPPDCNLNCGETNITINPIIYGNSS